MLQKSFSSIASKRMFIVWPDIASQETGSCEAVGLHNSCWVQSCRKSNRSPSPTLFHFSLFQERKVSTGRLNCSSKDPNTLLIISAHGHFAFLILLLNPQTLSFFALLSPNSPAFINGSFPFSVGWLHCFLSPVLSVANDSAVGFSYINTSWAIPFNSTSSIIL